MLSPTSPDPAADSVRRRAVLAKLPRISRLDGSAIRVLLVDDEDTLTNLVSLALSYEGWVVDVAHTGQAALLACCRRSLVRGKLLFTGLELSAINIAMEVHDAQLDLATVADIERALDIINAEHRAGRVIPVAVAA